MFTWENYHMNDRIIRRALLSVSDKTGLLELARGLAGFQVELISTGGTRKTLADAGLPVRDIAEVTGFPEMLDGRVKTLHPRIHGGILAVRDNPEHTAALQAHGIGPIDLVVCNLYPFEITAARPGVTHEEVIENIDIGGPSMIRSAAKNYRDVAVVISPTQYTVLLEEMRRNNGALTLEMRERLAAAAFARTAEYDEAIRVYFANRASVEPLPATWQLRLLRKQMLRYGENPHQRAAFYIEAPAPPACLANAEVLHGKELSYNNLLDLDSALNLIREFSDPAAVVIKHNNPCGAAVAASPIEAFRKAYEGDPQSAFGGILGFNREVDEATAMQITEPNRFVECIIAPDLEKECAVITHRPARCPPPARGRIRLSPRRRRFARTVARCWQRRFRAAQGRDKTRTGRGGNARSAFHLAGVQTRQKQRHCAGQGRHDRRCRRRADEPRRFGPHGRAQGWRAKQGQRTRFRCVLPLP